MNDEPCHLEKSPNSDDEISIVDLLATLLRYKYVIMGFTAVAAVLSLLYAIGSLVLPSDKSYLPNLYEPRALLLISQGSEGLASKLASSGLGSLASLAGISPGGASNGQLAVSMLKSNTNVDELNSEFDFSKRFGITKSIKSDTRNAFLSRFKAELDEKTGILSVSFTDIDPEFAMRVVNRSVEILGRRFNSLDGNKALEQKLLIESKLADVDSEIAKLQNEMQGFTARYGVLSIEALATEQVTVTAKLRAELIMKDIEIENYKKFSKIDDPIIRRLTSERDSIATAIREVESGKSGVLPGQSEIPTLAFQYAQIQRNLLVQTEILKLLTQQYEMAKMSAEIQEPAFQILELAEIPDKKSGPSRGKICVIATIAALFLSVFGAFILEAIRSIKADPEAMAKLKGTAR